MKHKIYLFAVILFFSFSGFAQTWTGNAGTDWNTPGNWSSPSAVPTPTSAVTIPATATNWPVLPAGTDVTIASLTTSTGSTLNFNSGALIVNGAVNISGTYNDLTNDGININITSNTNATVRAVTFNGNVTFNLFNAVIFYDGYLGSTIYNGNLTLNIGTSNLVQTSHTNVNTYNGSININRTVAGTTNLFNTGENTINNNFSYTNNAGGNTTINKLSARLSVLGTMDINSTSTGNFILQRTENFTSGGTVLINNAQHVDFRNDTLLANVTIGNINGSAIDYFYQNKVTGNVNFSDNIGNSNSIICGGNTLTGSTTITHNSPAPFYTGHTMGDVYNGDVAVNINGTGTNYPAGYNTKPLHNGNVSITRTGVGVTHVFANGVVGVNGNFSYTNLSGGNNTINQSNVMNDGLAPVITGTINLNTLGGAVNIQKMKNLTAGGEINIKNAGLLVMQNDTLVANIIIDAYGGPGQDIFGNNNITGNVTITEATTNAGNTLSSGNQISGNTSITLNSAAPFYISHTDSDVFLGDVSINKNSAGTLNASHTRTTYFYGNVLLNTNSHTFNSPIVFMGNTNTVLQQSGLAALALSRLVINKTNGATLTLNSPVTINNQLTFTNGKIITNTINRLRFNTGSTYENASANSHVIGFVEKEGGTAFTFPVGTATVYSPVSMSAPSSGTSVFAAAYYNQNPATAGYDTASRVAAIERVSGCEYWDVQRVSGTSNVFLTFSYGNACSGNYYVTNPAYLNIVHWNSATNTWENMGNTANSGTTTGTVTSALVSSFSPFTIGSTNIVLNPLPLTLVKFNANLVGKTVVLNWQSVHEQNVSHFAIERSVDGNSFETIGNVNANNNNSNNYNYTDALPSAGKNRYRLKITDNDGSFVYSNIETVNLKNNTSWQVTPVPAYNNITVRTNGGFNKISIVDVTGKVVLTKTITSNTENINITSLPKGLYFVQISNANEVQTQKIVKQ